MPLSTGFQVPTFEICALNAINKATEVAAAPAAIGIRPGCPSGLGLSRSGEKGGRYLALDKPYVSN